MRSTKPHEPFLVLVNTIYLIGGQTVFQTKPVEKILLCSVLNRIQQAAKKTQIYTVRRGNSCSWILVFGDPFKSRQWNIFFVDFRG